jgi:biopolymer transport protein TolR
MSMTAGTNRLTNDINVTPMIDVLLVLLIIFMAVLPSMRKSIDIQLPDPNPQVQPANAKNDQIVLEIKPGDVYEINTRPVSRVSLFGELKAIYAERPEKIIFVKADPAVKYGDVIEAMDTARGAGVKVIGIPPKSIGESPPGT